MPLYRYSLMAAEIDAKERRHPQLVIFEVAPEATNLSPHPIGDCWLFEAPEIANRPPFIDRVHCKGTTIASDPCPGYAIAHLNDYCGSCHEERELCRRHDEWLDLGGEEG